MINYKYKYSKYLYKNQTGGAKSKYGYIDTTTDQIIIYDDKFQKQIFDADQKYIRSTEPITHTNMAKLILNLDNGETHVLILHNRKIVNTRIDGSQMITKLTLSDVLDDSYDFIKFRNDKNSKKFEYRNKITGIKSEYDQTSQIIIMKALFEKRNYVDLRINIPNYVLHRIDFIKNEVYQLPSFNINRALNVTFDFVNPYTFSEINEIVKQHDTAVAYVSHPSEHDVVATHVSHPSEHDVVATHVSHPSEHGAVVYAGHPSEHEDIVTTRAIKLSGPSGNDAMYPSFIGHGIGVRDIDSKFYTRLESNDPLGGSIIISSDGKPVYKQDSLSYYSTIEHEHKNIPLRYGYIKDDVYVELYSITPIFNADIYGNTVFIYNNNNLIKINPNTNIVIIYISKSTDIFYTTLVRFDKNYNILTESEINSIFEPIRLRKHDIPLDRTKDNTDILVIGGPEDIGSVYSYYGPRFFTVGTHKTSHFGGSYHFKTKSDPKNNWNGYSGYFIDLTRIFVNMKKKFKAIIIDDGTEGRWLDMHILTNIFWHCLENNGIILLKTKLSKPRVQFMNTIGCIYICKNTTKYDIFENMYSIFSLKHNINETILNNSDKIYPINNKTNVYDVEFTKIMESYGCIDEKNQVEFLSNRIPVD
jgi:hypothetical protein